MVVLFQFLSAEPAEAWNVNSSEEFSSFFVKFGDVELSDEDGSNADLQVSVRLFNGRDEVGAGRRGAVAVAVVKAAIDTGISSGITRIAINSGVGRGIVILISVDDGIAEKQSEVAVIENIEIQRVVSVFKTA